jgi:hypothetical protein
LVTANWEYLCLKAKYINRICLENTAICNSLNLIKFKSLNEVSCL